MVSEIAPEPDADPPITEDQRSRIIALVSKEPPGMLVRYDGLPPDFTSRSRNSKGYLKLLQKIERAIPKGLMYLVADNLKTRKSAMVRG